MYFVCILFRCTKCAFSDARTIYHPQIKTVLADRILTDCTGFLITQPSTSSSTFSLIPPPSLASSSPVTGCYGNFTYCTTSGLFLKMNGLLRGAAMAWCFARVFSTKPRSPGTLFSFRASTSHLPSTKKNSTRCGNELCNNDHLCMLYLLVVNTWTRFYLFLRKKCS